MQELKLTVPTYLAELVETGGQRCETGGADMPLIVARHADGERSESGEKPEIESDFGPPFVPVVIRRADGVRIVLGTHDYDDCDKPDVQIERRPNGWAIFLHPLAGSDASGYVYFLDDGRSFVVKENGLGPTEVIEVREADEGCAEVDQLS